MPKSGGDEVGDRRRLEAGDLDSSHQRKVDGPVLRYAIPIAELLFAVHANLEEVTRP